MAGLFIYIFFVQKYRGLRSFTCFSLPMMIHEIGFWIPNHKQRLCVSKLRLV